MSLREKLVEGLTRGYFFSPKLIGIKRVRTLLSDWVDEYTENKKLKHLFARAGRSISMPSPKDFAILMGSLGWWTSDELYRAEIGEYAKRVEEIRAKFLAMLADPFFLANFKEVANAAGANPEKPLESVKFLMPTRKIHLERANEDQIWEIEESYKKDIHLRILRVIKQIRILLTSGVMGRKQRIEGLVKTFAILRSLNFADFRSNLIADLSKAFGSVEVLDRRNFPKDLDKYLNDQTLPRAIRTEILELTKASKSIQYWRLK